MELGMRSVSFCTDTGYLVENVSICGQLQRRLGWQCALRTLTHSTIRAPLSAFCHPFQSNQVSRDTTLRLSVMLPGNTAAEHFACVVEGRYFIGDIKTAVIAGFKRRFSGIDPDELDLFKMNDSNIAPLNSTQTLTEAGIQHGLRA